MSHTQSTVPDFMPVLSAGPHDSPQYGACVMEYVSLLAGESWSDMPQCTLPILARAAQTVNDCVTDEARHRLVPLIGRLMGTSSTSRTLEHRLAIWCARRVLPLVSNSETRDLMGAELVRIERQLGTPLSSAAGCNIGLHRAQTHLEVASARSAIRCFRAVARGDSELAASYAAEAVGLPGRPSVADDALVAFLVALLDEHDRLTGRVQPVGVTSADLYRVAAHIG